MKKIDPNNPAYPVDGIRNSTLDGINIRTYLAAMAIQGMCDNDPPWLDDDDIQHAAKYAVKIADALIAELNKE